jgi:hypothetical protein
MSNLVKFKTNNLHLNNKHEVPELEPILELFKGKIYSFLIKIFSNNCIEYLGSNIFSIKKSVSRTLTNMLSTWIFSLYVEYDYIDDYFLPTNYTNTKTLEIILRDMCKYDPNIVNVESKINKIIGNLKNNYKSQLQLLDEYRKSTIYCINKNNYTIKKSMIKLKKNKQSNVETDFYKFDIKVNFVIKDKRLVNILNNILIPKKIYEKLVTCYSGPKNKEDQYIWAILFRYQLLGSNNHQLAVLPNIMKSMQSDYGLAYECFASAINNTFNNFCSVYYDLERYFGSNGSFFYLQPIKGTFGFNPPYQKDVIEVGVNRLFDFLKQTNESLTFIITIPIWDIEGRTIMKEKYNNELEKQNIDYGEFDIIYKIKNSEYFKGLRMIAKEEFTYIDHNFELYKNKTIQNTYVMILSNDKLVTIDALNSYDFEKYSDNLEL